MIGGMSPASATGVGKRLKEVLVAHRDRLHEVSAICGRRVRQMSWRSFAVARPGQDLSEVNFPSPTLASHEQPPIVFLFSGQGPQHIESEQFSCAFASPRLTLLCSGAPALCALPRIP